MNPPEEFCPPRKTNVPPIIDSLHTPSEKISIAHIELINLLRLYLLELAEIKTEVNRLCTLFITLSRLDEENN